MKIYNLFFMFLYFFLKFKICNLLIKNKIIYIKKIKNNKNNQKKKKQTKIYQGYINIYIYMFNFSKNLKLQIFIIFN